MLHRQRPTPCLRASPPMTAQIATALGPTLDEPGALQQSSTVHVSEGSFASIWHRARVRLSPESRHTRRVVYPTCCANNVPHPVRVTGRYGISDRNRRVIPA